MLGKSVDITHAYKVHNASGLEWKLN
jgi:hypothetical protein